MNTVKILFWISIFMIFWANIGYPISILILGKIIKRKNKTIVNNEKSISIIITAHNEEKIIQQKLENVISLDYPKEKVEIIVTSDNSTDKTNKIVKEFIKNHPTENIKLYKVKKRMGKTNAQNEAVKIAQNDILVMTDANAIIKNDAIRELVKSFSENISYVTGKLEYINGDLSETSNSEKQYWDLDTKIRDIESNIQTITAGNGALYACIRKEYYNFKPIQCHDSAMPLYYALNGKRAIANHKAIAYEKAGENTKDEYKRKVRMSRIVLSSILPSIKILNVFKYKWFTYFYLGHRTSRYLLWFNHIMLLITNLVLYNQGKIYIISLIFQSIFYIIAIAKQLTNLNNTIINIIYYYCMTIIAQTKGVINTIIGKNKPFWEKAESTR